MNGDSSDKLVAISGKYAFRIGETFSSYEELEKRLELHCSESFVYYWRRDTRTVKGAHTKTSRPIANRLKYYSLRYACVFGGEKKKSRSQGKRHNNKSLRSDCPSFIMLRASKDGQNLEVVGVNNEHNHDQSVNQNLPHQRKLPEDVKQEAVEMMLLHIDRKKIIEYVKKKTNKSITVKDLFNLKAKYKNFNFKLDRSKDDVLQSMGLSPSTEERYENDASIKDESKEWMGVCYDENVIEYDEYSDYQNDPNVEIDVEVHSDNLLEYPESVECDKTEYEDTGNEDTGTDLHGYQFNEEEAYSIPDSQQDLVIEVDPEDEEEVTTTAQTHEPSNKNLRTLRLKCFIQRENNRLRKKLINCRICGTNPRFLGMQIGMLQAEKQKLLEETSLLRLTKEKLLNQVTLIDSDFIVE